MKYDKIPSIKKVLIDISLNIVKNMETMVPGKRAIEEDSI